jgi:hypothetical protein
MVFVLHENFLTLKLILRIKIFNFLCFTFLQVHEMAQDNQDNILRRLFAEMGEYGNDAHEDRNRAPLPRLVIKPRDRPLHPRIARFYNPEPRSQA